MAGIPKGNAIALQALKPLPELKVADLAANIIDKFEKGQAAKQAARLKALEDERKGIREFTDKIAVKPFSTISNITDQSSKLFRDTAEYIGTLGVMAEKDPSKRYEYQALMQKASNNYNSLATTFGNADFVKAAQEKLASYQSGDFFLESDAKEKLELISSGMLKMDLDRQTGDIKFALPRNANASPDEPAKWYSAGEVQSWYTKPEELDWMNVTKANGGKTFPSELSDAAKVFGDEWSKNSDGNRTTGWAGFAEKRANTWFDSRFGAFNANAIDPRLNQFAKKTIGSEIDSEEEYLQVKQAVIDNIGSQVPTATKKDTQYTAAQLEAQRLEVILRRKQIAEVGRQNQSQGTAPAQPIYNSTNQPTYVQVKDANGKVIGVKDDVPMRTLSLGKLKGQSSTTNIFGANRYRNSKGDLVTAYYLGTPASDGRTVTARVSEAEILNSFVKLGYNKTQAKSWLLEETADNRVPVIQPTNKIRKDSQYKNVNVFLKTKLSGNDEDEFL